MISFQKLFSNFEKKGYILVLTVVSKSSAWCASDVYVMRQVLTLKCVLEFVADGSRDGVLLCFFSLSRYSFTMVRPPVRGDSPRALAEWVIPRTGGKNHGIIFIPPSSV